MQIQSNKCLDKSEHNHLKQPEERVHLKTAEEFGVESLKLAQVSLSRVLAYSGRFSIVTVSQHTNPTLTYVSSRISVS